MFLTNVKSSIKIPLVMVVLAVINVLVVSTVSVTNADKMANHMTEDQIAAIDSNAVARLEAYMASIQEDLVVNADSDYIRQALRSFQSGWNDLTATDKTDYLHKKYIEENPNETGKKHLLDSAPDGSLYSIVHNKYHPWFRKLLEQREYYDIFIFDDSRQRGLHRL
jgi:methyl-accepting chemotaxis protein